MLITEEKGVCVCVCVRAYMYVHITYRYIMEYYSAMKRNEIYRDMDGSRVSYRVKEVRKRKTNVVY